MEPSPEQLSRLPKWAQDQIKRLESELEREKSALSLLSSESDDSPISYGYAADGMPRGFIPNGPVHFTIGGEQVTVSVSRVADELVVQGNSCIELIPVAANSIRIRVGKF